MSERKKVVLVVPTIRENCMLDFIQRWDAIGLFNHVDLMVMEDNPKETFKIDKAHGVFKNPPENLYHYSWEDIHEVLKTNAWIIPRRSDTVRSFAYYMAWKEEYPYILTLDDDCYPTTEEDGVTFNDAESFLACHLQYLSNRTRWFNTLNKVKPRGIPFYNLGKSDKAIVNHGLWTKVLDYDAPTQLVQPTPEEFSFDNRIVPNGQYFPMCGMNVMWKREATVLMYHLLMGQWQDEQQYDHPQLVDAGMGKYSLSKLPFDRFGDIWCGIFMKKIADVKRLHVSTGMPYIRHERASSPFANLKKEAAGIEVNEKLWEYADSAQISPGLSLDGCYGELAQHIGKYAEFPEHKDYFKKLGQAMGIWSELFRRR